MSHLHNLNKGLEMKIIELQLKLIEGERERDMAQEQWNIEKHNYEKVKRDTYIHYIICTVNSGMHF